MPQQCQTLDCPNVTEGMKLSCVPCARIITANRKRKSRELVTSKKNFSMYLADKDAILAYKVEHQSPGWEENVCLALQKKGYVILQKTCASKLKRY